MSASWLLMFIQPRIFKALPQWPLFVHSWCLWKLLALLKMFLEKEKPTTTKKMISFLWVSVIQVLYPVGNNFYLNVLNHRNVKGQHKKFVLRLTFILKLFFLLLSMHWFVFFVLFSLRCLTVLFCLSGLFCSLLFELWVNVSLCESLNFQHAVELRLGLCVFLLWSPDDG